MKYQVTLLDAASPTPIRCNRLHRPNQQIRRRHIRIRFLQLRLFKIVQNASQLAKTNRVRQQ